MDFEKLTELIIDFHGKRNATRCEIRCPDPAGNPYLQFALIDYIHDPLIREKKISSN